MTAAARTGAARSSVEATGERSLSAADANRRFYREAAERYDESEFCVVDADARQMLRDLLRRGLELVASAEPRVLDACGGSGNASEALLDLGVTPTVVDISPEMLSRWHRTAAKRGVDSPIVEAEITSFLSRDGAEEWDLIVFSSALHHLDDYRATVTAACGRLRPGGVLVTAFDPVRLGSTGQFLRRLDYAGQLAVSDPRGFLERVLAKARPSGSGGQNIGAAAERHAVTGISDEAIARALTAVGITVVEHRRYYSARLKLVRAAHRILRRPSSFSLIAHNSSEEARSHG